MKTLLGPIAVVVLAQLAPAPGDMGEASTATHQAANGAATMDRLSASAQAAAAQFVPALQGAIVDLIKDARGDLREPVSRTAGTTARAASPAAAAASAAGPARLPSGVHIKRPPPSRPLTAEERARNDALIELLERGRQAELDELERQRTFAQLATDPSAMAALREKLAADPAERWRTGL